MFTLCIMPNWCENCIVIEGVSDDIQTFIKENIKDGELDFSLSVPRPENAAEYCLEWNISHWGTKWNAYDCDINCLNNNNVLEISFITAWSPPLAWFKYVASKYSTLRFDIFYAEEGCDFSGKSTYDNGQSIIEHMGMYGEYYGTIHSSDSEEEDPGK